jgi:hypothetical protein
MASTMARSKVSDVDRGARALMKLVRAEGGLVLKVGVFGDMAAQAAEGGGGLTVGELAAAHEFFIPAGDPRSWLRPVLDEQGDALLRGIGNLYREVLRKRLTAKQALTLTGLAIVGKIQKRIAEGVPPALSPDYERRKLARYPGATKPLIASGQFRGSITSSVVPIAGVK